MKKSLICLAFFASFYGCLFATDVKKVFDYDSSKQQTGTVSFYKVSNLDQTGYYEFAVFQKDEETFDVLFDESDLLPQIQIGYMKYNKDY